MTPEDRITELLRFNNEFEERARVAERAMKAMTTPRPIAEYHEDMGPMLWWCWEPPRPFKKISEFVVDSGHMGQWKGEAPYVGSPLDLPHRLVIGIHYAINGRGLFDPEEPGNSVIEVGGWPGYHTHFTPLPPMPRVL